MSRESTLILLGLLVMASPYIGLPLSWRAILLPVLGLVVILIAITLRAKRIKEAAAAELPEPAPSAQPSGF